MGKHTRTFGWEIAGEGLISERARFWRLDLEDHGIWALVGIIGGLHILLCTLLAQTKMMDDDGGQRVEEQEREKFKCLMCGGRHGLDPEVSIQILCTLCENMGCDETSINENG